MSYTLTPINDTTYKLSLRDDTQKVVILYKTIKHIIKNIHLDSNSNTIYISSEKIQTFKQLLEKNNNKLSHHTCVQLFNDLSQQIELLFKYGYSFYGFDINMILLVNNRFIFCSTNYLEHLNKDNNMTLLFLHDKPFFSNPEINGIHTLPSIINHKCCYYSLGILLVFCLLNNHNQLFEDMETILYPIKNTKMYWCIKRCLEEQRLLLC